MIEAKDITLLEPRDVTECVGRSKEGYAFTYTLKQPFMLKGEKWNYDMESTDPIRKTTEQSMKYILKELND